MDQVGQLVGVALREVALVHGALQDGREEGLQLLHVLAELGEVLRGQHGAHGLAGRQVPAAEVLDLEPHVHAQLVHGVLHRGEFPVQVRDEALGLVQGVGHEQFAHVREVVVHRGAPHPGGLGHLGHGQIGEPVAVQQVPERVENGTLRALALGGITGSGDAGHDDTLPDSVSKRTGH